MMKTNVRARLHLLAIAVFVMTGAVAQAEDQRHPLAQALDYDTNMLLVADLRPNAQQLAVLQNAAGTVGRLVSGYGAAHAAALDEKKDLLAQERKALAEGTELAQDQEAALQALRDSEADRKQKMYSAADTEIGRLRRALAPEQAALVDWTAPADVAAAADHTAALDEMRLLAGRLGEAQRFIERMRYIIPTEYVQTRIGRIDDFLKDYDRPNTQQFSDDQRWISGLLDEARLAKEDEWAQQAPLFASRLLQRLGRLDEQAVGAQAAGPRYNWWDMYYLLADPQTPQMLQGIRVAGGNAGDNAGGRDAAGAGQGNDNNQ